MTSWWPIASWAGTSEPQLRDAIEANKTTDARKFVQYMFEPRDQKTYDLLIKDPMKWLTRQDRLPVGRNEKSW